MAETPKRVHRKVILPRYTPLVGTTPFTSSPLDVRAFAQVLLTGWKGAGIGATPADLEFVVQQSPDLEVWLDGTPFSPASANAEVTRTESLSYAWMRLKATVSGADPAITAWMTGEFVLRDDGDGAGAPPPAGAP
ncbi:MAG: hypothetical protein HUU06_05920 [Planctomycetaceae bacterium]|nr:hypothetical protein [Planctomycetaceae bacterium]